MLELRGASYRYAGYARQVLHDVLSYAVQEGFAIQGLIKSPLLGPKGNTEFLVWLGEKETEVDLDLLLLVESVLH